MESAVHKINDLSQFVCECDKIHGESCGWRGVKEDSVLIDIAAMGSSHFTRIRVSSECADLFVDSHHYRVIFIFAISITPNGHPSFSQPIGEVTIIKHGAIFEARLDGKKVSVDWPLIQKFILRISRANKTSDRPKFDQFLFETGEITGEVQP